MDVTYEGVNYNFPDDTQDVEIIQFLEQQNNKEFTYTQDDAEQKAYEESLTSGAPLPPVKQQKYAIPEYKPFDDKYLGALSMIESTNNPNAESSSGALGMYQFLPKTWNNVMKAYAPEMYNKYSEEERLELRRDPEISKYMADFLTRENAQNLEKRGATPTPAGLYLAHFLGVGEASDVLTEDSNTAIEDVVSEKSRNNNPNVFKNIKTVGDLIKWSEGKVKKYGS
jgi:hypothetical protein